MKICAVITCANNTKTSGVTKDGISFHRVMSDVRSACRVCLRPATVSVDSSRIFGDTALTVRQLLHLYTTAQFNESWLPQNMCNPCVKHLENCHVFNEKYTETHCELSHRFKHIKPKKSLHPILSRNYLSATNPKEIKLLPKTPLIINKYGIEVASDLTPNMPKLSSTHITQKKNLLPVIAIRSIAKIKRSHTNLTGSLESKSLAPAIALEQIQKSNLSTENIALEILPETIDANVTLNVNTELLSSEHGEKFKTQYYCHACQLNFYSAEEQNHHSEEYHFLRIRKCVICNKTFTSEKLLEKHKLTHRVDDAVINALIKEDARKDFLLESVGEKDERMPFDDLELVPEGPLFKYVKENTQFGVTKKVQCKLCGSIFKNHTSYLQHRSVHKSNVCWRCNCGWSTRSALLAHVATHSKFSCVLCVCTYASRTSLHTHYRRHHSVTAIPYFCGICADTIQYSNLCDLLQHLKVHNTSENVTTSIEPVGSEKIEETNIDDTKRLDQSEIAERKKEVDDKINIITAIDIDLKKENDINEDKIEKPTNFRTAETIEEAELTVNLEEAVNFFVLADLQDKSYVLKVEDYIERGDGLYQDLDGIELLSEEYTEKQSDVVKDTTVIEEIHFDNVVGFEEITHTEEHFQEVLVKEDYSKEIHSEAYFLDKIHKDLQTKEGNKQFEGVENFADEPELANNVCTNDVSISSDHTEEQLTDGLEVDEEMKDQDTATVHYYVVDNENGDNLVEITADQAQLLVNGETLEPRFDEKEGLLTDHSLVLESISPTLDLNQLFESQSVPKNTFESQSESPKTLKTLFGENSETQSKFQETYKTQSEVQDNSESQSELEESCETQSQLGETVETQSEFHKTCGSESELLEPSETQSEPKGTAETQSESCSTVQRQTETKKTFRPKRNHNNSLETESGSKFACQLCDVVVTRKYNLLRHLAVAHSRYTLRCSKCEKRFNNVALYEVHKMSECRRSDVSRKKGDTNNNPTCPVCDERFKRQPLLLRHIEDKHGEHMSIDIVNQHYVCKICNKTYRTRSGFCYHMEKHGGVPRFSCEHCSRRFTTNPALLNHVAGQHTDKRPHLCQQCGRGFVSSDHLRKHLLLVHGGRRDYLCVECGLTFQQASHVKQHQWVHTGIKPYSCKYCQGRFSSTSAIKKHMSRLHNAEYTRDLALQEVEYQCIEREQVHKIAASMD